MNAVRAEEATRLKVALDQVWREQKHLVQTLQLTCRAELIEQLPNGWAVHVGVGKGELNAYDVVNALNTINDSLEAKSNLFVIVLYDPGFDFTSHGPRPFANGEKTNGIRP